MKIAIDCRMYFSSGIGTVIQKLVTFLCSSKHKLILLGNRNDLKSCIDCDDITIKDFNEKIYSISEQIKFPVKDLSDIDLFISPHYNIPLRFNGRLLTIIHDLNHLTHPDFLPNRLAFLYAKFFMKKAVRKSCRIVTVSNHSKQMLIKYLNVSESKITVIHNGVDPFFSPADNSLEIDNIKKMFSIYGEYLLFVGNIKPHKNITNIIKSFSLLKKKYNHQINLLLTGEKEKLITAVKNIPLESEDEDIRNSIKFTGYISNDLLLSLYRGAKLFLFPSFCEGFGLPILEAMACGIPVITSNVSSMPEVAGDGAVLVDPYSPEDIAHAMNNVLEDEMLRSKLIERGLERAKSFQWDKAKTKYLKLIDEIGEENAI